MLENILKFSGIPENIENVNSENIGKKYDLLNSRYGHELIGILAEHCRDPSLMVRKQVVCVLFVPLHYHHCNIDYI